MAKISISRLFEAGPVIKAFQKANITDLEPFIAFLSDFADATIRALKGRLTFEDNFDCQTNDVELALSAAQTIYTTNKKIAPRHVLPTKCTPFSSQITAFNWQVRQDGNIDVVATFTPVPVSGKVTVRVLVLY